MDCISTNAVEIEYCRTCQGIWFDKSELTKIKFEYNPGRLTKDKVIYTSLILEAIVDFIAMLPYQIIVPY